MPVAGVASRQAAQRHRSPQEASVRGCFAGSNKPVYLIGKGEGAAVSAERLDVAGVRGSFGEIGQERGGGRQPLFTRHGLFFHAPQTRLQKMSADALTAA